MSTLLEQKLEQMDRDQASVQLDGDQVADLMISSDPIVQVQLEELLEKYVSCVIPLPSVVEERQEGDPVVPVPDTDQLPYGTTNDMVEDPVHGFPIDMLPRDSEHHPSLFKRTISHPDSIAFKRDVARLVRANQFHARRHRQTCFKGQDWKQRKVCRFGFPKFLQARTELANVFNPRSTRSHLKVLMRRNHTLVNNFNENILVNWRANMDIQCMVCYYYYKCLSVCMCMCGCMCMSVCVCVYGGVECIIRNLLKLIFFV